MSYFFSRGPAELISEQNPVQISKALCVHKYLIIAVINYKYSMSGKLDTSSKTPPAKAVMIFRISSMGKFYNIQFLLQYLIILVTGHKYLGLKKLADHFRSRKFATSSKYLHKNPRNKHR